MSDTMQIFTVLIDSGNRKNLIASHGVAPSIYMREMSLTTEERTASLMKQERSNELSAAGQSSVCFRATPKIVIFQQFSPGSTYSVTLSVTNITSSSQHFKMIHTKNSWFTIECKDAVHRTKLAPGMSMVFNVKFLPEERRDYKYQAVFAMGVETLTVPILAIGPRPLLDFPDSIEVPETAVKILSVKHLLVRNIGDVPAVFSLSTNRPFTVHPQKGVLAEGETMQMTVNLLSEEKGCFKGKLLVTYETGEIISLNLCGSAENCVIRLERGSIRMEETYLGLTRSRTFAIHNRSNYVSNFRWVLYENSRRDQLEQEKNYFLDSEDFEKRRHWWFTCFKFSYFHGGWNPGSTYYCSEHYNLNGAISSVVYKRSFGMIKNVEVARGVDLEHYNICDSLLHELACQRVYADELSCLEDQTFPFRHPSYRLIPSEGEIWPHSTADVTLIFEPDEIGAINGRAYLEVTGCEERIPLNLHGVCAGPLIKLNVISADLGCILLCSNHNYEVICGNKGDIPGTLVYKPRPADFGGKIEVNPVVQAKLKPGSCKSFNLSFSSNRTGDFTEKIEFIVKESLEVISLLIKGSVICPTLHFDKQDLDFGVTALGFTTRHDVCLHNSSLVPVTFCLAITQDGTQPALTHEDFARSMTKPSLIGNPKEFVIVPSEGVVAPHDFQRIKISYTPNVVRSSQTALRADMWDSDSEPVTLPIMFSSKVAALVVRPSEILIRFCFINFPYMRSITVENKSDVEGYFYLPPQSVTISSAVMYSLSSHQGYLKPNESKSISLKIVTTSLGREKVQLSLLAFGDRTLVPCCSLICNGQGPIVTVQPTQINWGEVQLLEAVKSTITLANDSPIPAQFIAGLHKTPSPWKVSPASGALESNKSLELEITIYLCDTGKYSDKVDIEIMNSRVITCSLTAVGIGSSISLTPNMMPEFDMGLLFRDQDISIPITMANKGTRHHRLTWTTTADLQVVQMSGTNDRKQDKFTIDPHITELPPGAESVIHCKIRWGVNVSLTEQWYLHGQIEGERKRQVLGTSVFRAAFTNPIILFSKRKLMFRYDPCANETKAGLIDTLFVTNRSGLDLRTCVNIDPPFEMIAETEDAAYQKTTTILLRNEVETRISIRFNTQAIDLSNLCSRTFQRALTFDYEMHRSKDKIECLAEVNYPNISISPMEPVILSCEIGSTAQKNVTLINTGQLPVRYSFEWLVVDVIQIPTTAYDTPFLQDSAPDIDESDEELEEEAYDHEVEEVESNEEQTNAIGFSLEQEYPEVLSTSQLEQPASFASATSNDLVTPYVDNPDPKLTISSKELVISAEVGDNSFSGSPSRRLSNSTVPGNNEPSISVQVAASDIRDFIFPMVERYFLEDAEISILKDSRPRAADEPPYCRDLVTRMLDVVPREGIILPHSSQFVYFRLDASQPIEIDAKIACRVESGPTETISVRASADTIRYSIDKKHVDFRRQLFGELCRTTLTIVNQGVVEFTFETSVASEETGNRTEHREEIANAAHLKVEPRCGVVSPMSQVSLDVIYHVGMLGQLNAQFDLEIAHRVPIPIHVRVYGSLPQIYLTIPRSEAFERLPVEIGYQAVSTLNARFLGEVRRCSIDIKRNMSTGDNESSGYLGVPKCERERLTARGWELISPGSTMPTVIDVDMAVERLLANEHIHGNPYILADHNSAAKKKGISSLSVPEYVIDMGHVVIDRVGYYSAMLINYGPTPVDVHIRKEKGKCNPLKKSGIVVQFHDRKDLPVGESTPLNISFHPTQAVYPEKRTVVEHTIHLEVTHGATIPILVRAVATYPFLTAHTGHLSFEKVAVGDCMLMPILLRNDGWVPCEWQATIRCEDSCRSKQDIGPFFLHYSADTFLPGFENVINVYFKPKEAKHSMGQLRIKIDQSIFPVLVSMSGTGIAPEVRVFEDTLTFETTLPYVQPLQKTLSVKNIGSYPVEVFWRNFDTGFMEEERMIRVLTHYYGVNEILFPPRQPGDKLSSRIYHFYQTLSEEMTAVLAARKSGSERSGGKTTIKSRDTESREKVGERMRKEDADGDKDRDEEAGRIPKENGITPHQRSGRTETSLTEQLNGVTSSPIGHKSSSHDQIFKEFPGLNVEDPDQIEHLLHWYIDELHEQEDFSETMKDPVKEVFEDAEIKSPSIDHSLPLPRACIIFHGAPFTAYQQAACQVGKTIGLPVLNIDKAVTEIIALGNSACSIKLREIVDENYYALLSRSETYRKKLSLEGPRPNSEAVNSPVTPSRKLKDSKTSSRRTPRTAGKDDAEDLYMNIPRSPTVSNERVAEDRDQSMKTFLKLPAEPDALEEFNKIPQSDELKSMDPLDEYEYKIQSVFLLQTIMASGKIVEEKVPRRPQRDTANDKASGRSGTAGKKKLDGEGTFLGISSDLIYEALKQRFAMQDYQAGFTVQTLDNIFVKNERDTLVMLLSLIGNVRYLLFLTFHNTLNMYQTQNEKLIVAEEMKATKELEDKMSTIEHMSLEEYEHVSEEEKILYASITLAVKRADSQRRRLIYNQRLAEAKLNRKTPPPTKSASIAALTHGSKPSKSRTTHSGTMKSLVVSSNESRSTKVKPSTPANSGKTTEGVSNEVIAMKQKLEFPKELEEISRVMDSYRISLATLQPVLENWDPQTSTYIETVARTKTPKSTRGSDMVQEQTDENKGIDVWYVAPMDPWDSEIYDEIATHLTEIDDIKTILHEISRKESNNKVSLDSKSYTVACQKSTDPSSSAAELQSDVYTLTPVMELSAAVIDVVENSITRTSAVIGEVAGNVRPDETTFVSSGPRSHEGSVAAVAEEPLKPRWIMQPNELCKFKVHFAPKCVGDYKNEYALGIAGSDVTRRIRVSGSVDIPSLSMAPEMIFSKVEETKLDDLNMPTYFLDTKTYDFGSIPLTKSEDKELRHRREAKFVLTNTSTIPAIVSFFRMDNAEAFGIVPDLLNIAPGKSEILNVWAGASKVGPNPERLLLCIRDNPQVEIIQLQSFGSKLEVELEGKVVAFEKMLLWRKAKHTIIVRNKSSVPLHWKLDMTDCENSMDAQVTFDPEKGLVKPLATSDIECNYSAQLVGVVERKISFQVYLDEYDTDPLLTDLITITGETYDVKVDLTNASPIDLKSVEVGMLATEKFTITNRGPYDIGFIVQSETPTSLDQSKLNLPPTLKEDFNFEPASGSLSPEKPMVIAMSFLPRTELAIFEAPLLKCLLIDTHKTPTAVAEFPLLVSISAYYAKVKIQPNTGLNFGSIAIFDKKTMHFDIQNVGCFSFKYKINGPAISDLASNIPTIFEKSDKKDRTEKIDKTERLTSRTGTATQSKKDNKTPRSAKATRSGRVLRPGVSKGLEVIDGSSLCIYSGDQKIPSLKVGPFAVWKDEGEVEAGEVETIEVQCCPDSVSFFEEEIQVFVPNTGTKRKNVQSVKLSANACIPTVDLDDFDAIFRENLIVDRLDDFTCPRELGPHSIYGREEKCLYFRRVRLSSKHTARFRLHNPGFVFSDVTVKFDTEMNDPVHGDGRTGAFAIEPQKAKISPMSTEVFTVSFSPKLLGSYAAAFNVVLELPPPLKDPWVGIKICGEAIVPEVVLLEPTTPYTNDQILMNFGRSLVDEAAYRLISFKNVGSVEAKVIAEISGDSNSLFTFEATDQDVETSRDTWRRNRVEDDRRIVRNIMPEEIACMNVKFAPTEVVKCEGRVDIFTVDNPYDKISLVILGEGYVEDVILEGLALTENTYATSFTGKRTSRSRKGSRDSQLKSSFATSTELIASITAYKLDYGSCFLNKVKQICFAITNKSKEQLFRFDWGSHPNVVFSPSVGYLNVHGSKDIIATFSAPVPIVHTETQLECTINEISQLPEEMNDMCWDDRQMSVRWDAGESGYSLEMGEGIDSRSRIFTKVTEPIPDPAKRYVVPGSMKTIRVMLCGAAAYSRYDCSIREINFNDVLVFQSCKYSFVLSNSGIVDMAYKWDLHTDTRCPRRLSNSALWEVLRSFEKPCMPSPRPKSRMSSGTLYPTEHDNQKSSIIVSSKADNTKHVEASRCNAENASDLFSGTAISNKSSADGSVESDYLPFEILPEAGVLLPGESVECTLVFSPLDVFDYQVHLTCRIENLDPDLPPLSVTVTARSLLPYCHFVIPESDYLSGGKRDAAALGPLMNDIDSSPVGDVRVVEMQAIGVGQTLVKKFHMINPTAEDYRFSWRERKTRCLEEISYFDCVVAEGVALGGKQAEFKFTFLAKDVGVFESLWTFSIDRYALETTFLFVATVREPSVYLFPGHLDMKPTVIGGTAHASITIFNSESIQLPFRIIPESLYSEDRLQRLIIEPMSGTLDPNGEEHLEIEFQPASPGETEFSLRCRIDKLKNPLSAVIITTTYSIEPSVVYKRGDGEAQQIHRDENNVVDCGNIQLHKPFTLNIHITNVGGSAFRYKWNLRPADRKSNGDKNEDQDSTEESVILGGFTVDVQSKQGHIISQSSVICPLTVTARRKAAVLNHRVILKIHRGPGYAICLKGVVQDPSYLLNFNTYDFGPSYIPSGNVCHDCTKIHFTNNEETPCTLECKIESLPHLRVDHEHLTGAVPGLSSVSVPVKFIPLERVRYRETIRLLINSTIEEKITVLGEGTAYKVCLVDPRHKYVDLGNTPVGKSVTRKVPLMNKGRAPIVLRIGLVRELPAYPEVDSKLEACEFRRNRHGDTVGPSTREVLTIEPSEPITLPPNREIDVFVTYSPVKRTPTFEEKIGCQMHETILPLFIINGACIGAEFSLDRTILSFGTVVEGCSRKMKITLTNTGDIGGRFTWDVGKLMPHYNLLPQTGYCSSGMDVSFIVTFSPMFRSNFIEGQATIDIENYETMILTVSGACESFPEPVDTVHLSTRVRQPTSVDITVVNTSSNETWTLEPVVSGEFFTATEIFTIPPLKSNVCTVTYKPLLMTIDDKRHKGTIFFKLPEGLALVYVLVGTSLPPEAVAKISREFPARTKYTELLPVSNWLKKTQRFFCIFELLDDAKGDSVYNLLGNKTIDIPSEEQRDYRAVFDSYKEGSFHFRVTFKNEEGEYHLYELNYKVTKPGIADTIKLTAAVRTVACHSLKLENPLRSQPVTYTIESPHSDVSVSESSKLVNPQSTEIIKIEFNPMVPFESMVMLDASCAVLGTFSYSLSLKATPAAPEKLVRVSAMLGNSVTLPITVKNFRKQAATFSITIDDPSFSCGRNISTEGFGEGTMNITYEPCELRNISATLTATSQIAGEYIFPIIGTVTPPKPQGPFTVACGRAASIPFKNIFDGTRKFDVHVDAPDIFRIDRPTETIQSKKTVKITVSLLPRNGFEDGRDIDAPITGRLTVCSTEVTSARIKWIYYLRGVFQEYK